MSTDMNHDQDDASKMPVATPNDGAEAGKAPGLPDDMLIILPVRNLVLFPGVILPVAIKREKTVAGAQEAVRVEGKVGFLLQKDPQADDPTFDELHRIGTAATIVRYVTAPDGTHHLVCQGERRFRVLDAVGGFPYLVARVEYLSDTGVHHPEVEARSLLLKQKAVEAITLLPQAPAELANSIQAIESPAALADTIASFLDIKPAEKQELLETTEIRERLERVATHLTRRVEVLKLSRQIEEQTKEAIDDRQREYVLREQLKQIQKELGEETEAEEAEELAEAITKAGMPAEVDEHARKELKRLERMNEASGEYSMARTYLDTLIALPWSKLDAESIDIQRARGILDADHYGLEKIKKRILEYLAVRKLNPEGRSPILCFVGPPGVGKTSLGQSIARAIGLKFQRTSLGGTHDEAEIRGHRRTYIGALPGNIIQAIRKAGTRNPVLMLDEIDKLGHGIQGDPASALLEVLDPEQNSTFRDNYLGVPFDLSKVLFIATANQLDTIPGPLRDRMEIIELTGYTEEEKVEIARRYLVRRQLEANGLKAGAGFGLRRGAALDRARVHARSGLPQPRARDRCGAAQRRGARGRRQGDVGPHRSRRRARDPRRAEVRERSRHARQRAGRGHGPRLDAGGRRHPVHRSDPHSGQRQADPHRAARRRDEGKRAGGAEPAQVAGRVARRGFDAVRKERHPRAHPGGRDPEGRAKCRRDALYGARVTDDQQDRAQRRRHDGRDQLARARAAGRRHQGEDGGCASGRDPHGDAAGAQPARPGRHPGKRAQGTHLRVARARRRCGCDRRLTGRCRRRREHHFDARRRTSA